MSVRRPSEKSFTVAGLCALLVAGQAGAGTADPFLPNPGGTATTIAPCHQEGDVMYCNPTPSGSGIFTQGQNGGNNLVITKEPSVRTISRWTRLQLPDGSQFEFGLRSDGVVVWREAK